MVFYQVVQLVQLLFDNFAGALAEVVRVAEEQEEEVRIEEANSYRIQVTREFRVQAVFLKVVIELWINKKF